MCVTSGGPHGRMRRTLGVTGLCARFAGRVFGAAAAARGTPSPGLFPYPARRMGGGPAACAVVEDVPPRCPGRPRRRAARLGYAGGLAPPERSAGPASVVCDAMRELPGPVTGRHREVSCRPGGIPYGKASRRQAAGGVQSAGRPDWARTAARL
ncbi:hypothetical protein ACFV4Q_36800 [Streptomyces nojiriensis]|uniref:hypothetical protein n=1 Tax=Streptomyces nojiriensis TaxID=66374 RepID=UPI00365EEE1D